MTFGNFGKPITFKELYADGAHDIYFYNEQKVADEFCSRKSTIHSTDSTINFLRKIFIEYKDVVKFDEINHNFWNN